MEDKINKPFQQGRFYKNRILIYGIISKYLYTSDCILYFLKLLKQMLLDIASPISDTYTMIMNSLRTIVLA